jgi:radical SAM protein with 4Fe4S-binding SPASM domain
LELILKPTEACNFKCTFCSSTSIAASKRSVLDLNKVFEFLERFPNTSTIIINGGDPLMMPPEYYFKIIEHLDAHDLKASLSLTTNLWSFYLRPAQWSPLFRHPRVGVSTSFNYGETRRITKDRVFTEEIFWKVSNLFYEEVGRRPDFISVITEENEDTAIDNVRLAQKMGVECKLNYAMASGIQGKPYLLSKIYKIYLEVYRLGLMPWEFNTKQMVKRISSFATACPQNRDCDSGIRCLQPDGDYYSCGAFGDDKEYAIDFQKEMASSVVFQPLKESAELVSLKTECFGCPMFDICNGCRKTVRDLKQHALVEEHCTLMKTLAPDILALQVGLPTGQANTLSLGQEW